MVQKMDKADVLETIALAFAKCDYETWTSVTGCAVWAAFLEGCRDAVRADVGKNPELVDLMDRSEVNAIHNPPTFSSKQHFAACHFTGGLPVSAVPVESLYQSKDCEAMSFAREAVCAGHYGGRSAAYMSQLVQSLGLSIPDEFQAYPDHLALESDMAALLFRSGADAQAESFIVERFPWIAFYRMHLVLLHSEDALFYVGLLDVLMGMMATCESKKDQNETSSTTTVREDKTCQNTL